MRRTVTATVIVSIILGMTLAIGMLARPPKCQVDPTQPGCRPTPTPRPSSTPTATPTASPTSTPTSTPTPSPSPTPTSTPVATATPTPSASPTPTATATPTPTATPGSCTGTLQSRIDGAPSGGTLNLGTCAFTGSATINKALTMVGGRLSGGRLFITANDVTVDGIQVFNGTAPAQAGNIHIDRVSRIAVRNVTVADSAGACISINFATTVVISDSEFARCAQEGFHGQFSTDVDLLRNRIHHNNQNGQYDSGHEAGGGKITNTTDVRFIGNHSYSNGGPGLWCDINCRQAVFDSNRVHDNTEGIFFEISDGAEIMGNVVYRNGGTEPEWCYKAGILVSSSKNVYVHDNIAAWNNRGISFLSQNRGGSWNDVSGNRAANNTVIDQDGRRLMNWCHDWASNLFSSGNTGTGGRYWTGLAEPQFERFEWQSPRSTLADFNATPGEEGGAYLTVQQKDAILAVNEIPATP